MTRTRLPIGRIAALTIWFVLLWLLLWSDLSIANVASGLAVAALVIVVSRGTATNVDDDTVRIAPFALVHFFGHVLWQLVRANLTLAREILSPASTVAMGTIEVRMRSASPIVTMAVSNVVTLTPGTVTIDTSTEPTSLTIWSLHLHDPEAASAGVRITEALAIRAFGTRSARAALALEEAQS